MAKKVGRLTLATLILVLVGSQWSYAHEEDEREHRKSVPEPATLTLMAVGLAGIAAIRRRRKDS